MLRWMLGSIWRKPKPTEDSSSDESEPEPAAEEEGIETEEESWVDWVRRTTHHAEDQLRKVSLDDCMGAGTKTQEVEIRRPRGAKN